MGRPRYGPTRLDIRAACGRRPGLVCARRIEVYSRLLGELMGAKCFGAAVKRREDPRFLRGEGRFVDDVTLPGMLHAAFVRSPHAHARIIRIHTTAAAAAPGVVRVLTFADLQRWMKPLPLFGAVPPGLAAVVEFDVRQAPQWALCRDRARYVGEIVAMVVAGSPERAADAVDLLEVDWEPLPPVVDVHGAGAAGSPLVHPDWGSNVGVGFTHAIGDADGAFAGAAVTVTETFRIQRYVGMPLEGRGVVAAWDRRDGMLTTWNSTQVTHFVQQGLTGALGLPPHKLRVVAPDLGGGFGTKASGYAEDALVPIAAIALGRPVKWIESRREHMSGAAHARDQVHTISRAARRDGDPLVYDTGALWAALESALEAAGYKEFRAEQARLRARGVHRGIGISGYVEGTAIGPFEGATVKLDLAGRVVVATGAVNSGQGHETSFAQVAADALGVPLDWVTVVGGDTAAVPFGVGTFASRSAVTAGSSIADACREVRGKLVRAAATLLEAAPGDVEIDDGKVFVRGAPGSAVDLARVVQASIPTFARPGVASPDFEATAYHHVPTVTYASAVHVAQVEVDVGTGGVKLLRYVVAHDCGRVINPPIVEGQVHGGVAQGVGGALFEEMVYDASGQLLTGSLMDYAVPKADDLPPIETIHLEFPSPRNPLGVKGLGEGGAISPPAAIANAIEDALAPFGVRVTETPVTPARIVALLRKHS